MLQYDTYTAIGKAVVQICECFARYRSRSYLSI